MGSCSEAGVVICLRRGLKSSGCGREIGETGSVNGKEVRDLGVEVATGIGKGCAENELEVAIGVL